MINSMRDIDDDDIQVQCDVFYDEKQEDDESWSVEKPHGVDLNSHTDVFNAIFHKVKIPVEYTTILYTAI